MTVGASVQHGASVHWGCGGQSSGPWGAGYGAGKQEVALGAAGPLFQGLMT